jgi:hypothetical protein
MFRKQDTFESGTPIDPDTDEDMELIGWSETQP